MTYPSYTPQQYPDTGQKQQQYQQPRYGQPQQPAYQQPQYAQYQYGQQPYVNPQPADTGSFGWAALGFLFPIVGLILFLIWKDNKPVSAKQAGMGALVSVIISVVLWIIVFMLALAAGSAAVY